MTRNQKILAILLVLVALILGSLPALVLAKYNKELLPILNLELKSPKQSKQVPFALMVSADHITNEAKPSLTVEEKTAITYALATLFHAHMENLIFYFNYFILLESNTDNNPEVIMLIFSSEPPTVALKNKSYKFIWDDKKIIFDILNKKMLYSFNETVEFFGINKTSVRVFYSSSLRLNDIGDEIKRKKLKEDTF